jgi:hypothetical protein
LTESVRLMTDWTKGQGKTTSFCPSALIGNETQ